MVTIEKLNAFGADTSEGLARCYNNETLYLRLINMLPKEKNFDKLQTALQENDLDAAFEAAHALKGVTGNPHTHVQGRRRNNRTAALPNSNGLHSLDNRAAQNER